MSLSWKQEKPTGDTRTPGSRFHRGFPASLPHPREYDTLSIRMLPFRCQACRPATRTVLRSSTGPNRVRRHSLRFGAQARRLHEAAELQSLPCTAGSPPSQRAAAGAGATTGLPSGTIYPITARLE
ncbi:hypothetical protein GCM10027612_87380 [Microbispora bryophytorum subsp. camponoti]